MTRNAKMRVLLAGSESSGRILHSLSDKGGPCRNNLSDNDLTFQKNNLFFSKINRGVVGKAPTFSDRPKPICQARHNCDDLAEISRRSSFQATSVPLLDHPGAATDHPRTTRLLTTSAPLPRRPEVASDHPETIWSHCASDSRV